ncbi:hypothetical protein [Niallia taxi]|uniref:hypothetical protein n=1 Tax=Niallia taxi TaxID=2499688 RepID=UPI0015F3D529|nr:hypothetical protein [Niallia taxi]
MTTLINNTQLFAGLKLDQLLILEHEIEVMKQESYATLSEIEELETISDEEYAQFEEKSSILGKMFKKLETALEKAVEIAAINEENGHFA